MVKASNIFLTGRKDRYKFMCAVDVYDKDNLPITYYTSSYGDRALAISFSEGALF